MVNMLLWEAQPPTAESTTRGDSREEAHFLEPPVVSRDSHGVLSPVVSWDSRGVHPPG